MKMSITDDDETKSKERRIYINIKATKPLLEDRELSEPEFEEEKQIPATSDFVQESQGLTSLKKSSQPIVTLPKHFSKTQPEDEDEQKQVEGQISISKEMSQLRLEEDDEDTMQFLVKRQNSQVENGDRARNLQAKKALIRMKEEIKTNRKDSQEEKNNPNEKAEKEKCIWSSSHKTGEFDILHGEIKMNFTIKQHQISKMNLEKIGFCKTEGCLVKCKLVLRGGSKANCELFFNQYAHKATCVIKKDIYKNSVLIDLCKLRLTPSDIIKEFNNRVDNEEKLNDSLEVRRKISRMKCDLKPNQQISKINDMRQFERWLQERCVSEMTSEELKSLPWDQTVVANYEIYGNRFVALITSKNLQMNILKQIAAGELIKGADGTYKLNTEGHPTIVSGIYDLERKFHLNGFGLTTQEDEDSYRKIFQFEKEFFTKCFPDVVYEPRYLMADGALYIRKGAHLIWENITPTLCSFHFWKAIRDKLRNKNFIPKVTITDGKIGSKTVPKSIFEQFESTGNAAQDDKWNPARIIRYDIKVLQLLPNEMLFNKYLKLIKPFWIYFGKKFWDYFITNYVDIGSEECRSGWQNALKSNSVATNNSLEAFNRVLKEVQTHHTKLPIEEYLECLCDEVKRRSIQSACLVNFPTTPIIWPQITYLALALHQKFNNLFLQRNACYYIKDKYLTFTMYNPKTRNIKKNIKGLASKVHGKHEESLSKFYSYYSKPSVSEVTSYENGSCSLKILFLRVACIRKIEIAESDDEDILLRNSKCSCPDWFTRSICPHLVACLKKEGKINLDVEWRRQKSRGRPPKVPGAFIKE